MLRVTQSHFASTFFYPTEGCHQAPRKADSKPPKASRTVIEPSVERLGTDRARKCLPCLSSSLIDMLYSLGLSRPGKHVPPVQPFDRTKQPWFARLQTQHELKVEKAVSIK
jgi:hypothetical protein